MAGARVTRARLLASAAFAGGIRVTHARLISAAAQPGAIRVSHFRLIAALADRPGLGMRVSHFRVLQFRSLNRAFYLDLLDSTSEIFPLTEDSWLLELVAGPIPEFNPYKPQVPESLIEIPGAGRDFFDYIEENQKTLRLQHNITQAGDTTFPYEMIINTHDAQQFTLGSVGKFYHEDYGMIHARYVQFEKMNLTLPACSPVGLIKNTAKLDWIVTNRLEISDPALVVGINTSYTTPKDGTFGWVTVNGVNLQPIAVAGTANEVGTPYSWSASGQVSPTAEGVVVCRRLEEGGDAALLKGRAWIRLEGSSFGAIDAHYADLIADVEQLKVDVLALQEANDVAATLAAINTTIKQLQLRLASEENARRAADTAINARISALQFVTAGELAQEILQIQNTITTLQTTLTNSIAVTHGIAVEALQKANQALALDLGAINDQITLILGLLAEETNRAKGKFPIVDGMVPPNLVYLDDGSLVYVETF